jgi:uncharacterized surface protein with fasciclin (FAS1) repeats
VYKRQDQDLSILEKAIKATGFDDLLNDANAVLTLFAPDDEAFQDLLKRFKMSEDELLNKPFLLSRILEYHIIGDEIISEEDLEDGRELETEARFPPIIGKRMKLTVREGADGGTVLDGIGSNARVVEKDKQACAAIVHIIDTVLLPFKAPSDESWAES